ncbi:hypothetical protein [Belnapia moabensis]|uniref:hypothetical protein n=1 Tax=Belnapia moabensis TaxID=365533 RepID=UPI0005BADADE|nr:hypothetical protein [Belnapia moabensis]
MASEQRVTRQVTPSKKLVVRFGRGRLGGTTYLDALAQRAMQAGREVILVDADVRNPSLSKLYPNARVPAGGSPEEFAEMMAEVLGELADYPGPVSLLVDIGGGQDRAMAEFIRDLNLVGFCDESGVQAVAAYMLGPHPDDLAHALSVRDAGLLDGGDTILVLSEAVVKRGQTPETAFAPLRREPAFIAWVEDGALPVPVRNLACLEKVRGLGLGLGDAMAGKRSDGGKPLGPVERFQIRDWFRGFEARHTEAEALDLLP